MDLPYCQLCSEYFYTPIDYEAHLVSDEHLQRLLTVSFGQPVSTSALTAANQEDAALELELVQSDFIYVHKHTHQMAQIYKAYQNYIRQIIPFGHSYILLLDAVPPSMWQGMISALNQYTVSYPLFVQSGTKGVAPGNKRLMEFVLVVDIDSSTTASQLAFSVGAEEADVVLITGDAGSDATGFLRIGRSNRQVALDRIRSARVPPRQRQLNVFELWGPSASHGGETRSPTPPPMQTSLSTSPKLNKDVPRLLASLSSKTKNVPSASTVPSALRSSVLREEPRPPSPSRSSRLPSASLSSGGGRGHSSSRRRTEESSSRREKSHRRSRSRSHERKRSRSRSRYRDREQGDKRHNHSRDRYSDRDPERAHHRDRDRTRSRNDTQSSVHKERSQRNSSPPSTSAVSARESFDIDESPCYMQRYWSMKFGGMPYMEISGFDLDVDSIDLADAVSTRMGGIESIYACVNFKDRGKCVICTFNDRTPMPSVNEVKANLKDLCSSENLYVQEYTEGSFDKFKFNLPHKFFFVPLTKARAFEPMFLLIWNIPTNVHPNHILYNMRRSMPSARSFVSPRICHKWLRANKKPDDQVSFRNSGFVVARFNNTEDCSVMMQRLEEAAEDDLQAVFSSSKVKFSFVCMQETCLIPPFSFPCHNILLWDLDADWDSTNIRDALPDRPFVPFLCNCHPDSVPIAPHPFSLDAAAKHIVDQLAADGPAVVCQKLNELLKIESDPGSVCVENKPSCVPPIELSSVRLGSTSSYWCLLYGPDIYFSAKGFPLSMDSLEIEEIVKRVCDAYCVYVTVYPQPVPQVLTKQAVFRCTSALSSPTSQVTQFIKHKILLELERLQVSLTDSIFVTEWSYRTWEKFKNLRPFMIPFCPLPNGYRKPHFIMVWNINPELGKHVFVRNFLKKYPHARSVTSPNMQPGQVCRNPEYCVLRFDDPEECIRAYASMRLMPEQEIQALCPRSEVRFILCRMEETCYVRPFLFPCHNFFFWYGRSDDGRTNNGDKLFVEPWSRRFDCSCHPYCEALTPVGPQLLRFARMVHTAVEKSTCEAVKNCLLMYIEATQEAQT